MLLRHVSGVFDMLENKTLCRNPPSFCQHLWSLLIPCHLRPASSVNSSLTSTLMWYLPSVTATCVSSAAHSCLLWYLWMSVILSDPVLSRLFWLCTSMNHFFLTHRWSIFISELHMCTSIVSILNIVKLDLLYSKYQELNEQHRHVYRDL